MLTRRSLFAALAGLLSGGASARSHWGVDPLSRALPIISLKNAERFVSIQQSFSVVKDCTFD